MRVKIAIITTLTAIFFNIYIFSFNFNLLVEWKVYIPVVTNLKYSKISGASFPYAPDEYKVYEYKNPLKKTIIKCNEWHDFDKNIDLEIIKKATGILDFLEVPNSKRPDFDKEFKYIFKHNNYKELYLFYFEYDSIYIISRF